MHFGISIKVLWIDRVFSCNPDTNHIWLDLRIYEIIEITHQRLFQLNNIYLFAINKIKIITEVTAIHDTQQRFWKLWKNWTSVITITRFLVNYLFCNSVWQNAKPPPPNKLRSQSYYVLLLNGTQILFHILHAFLFLPASSYCKICLRESFEVTLARHLQQRSFSLSLYWFCSAKLWYHASPIPYVFQSCWSDRHVCVQNQASEMSFELAQLCFYCINYKWRNVYVSELEKGQPWISTRAFNVQWNIKWYLMKSTLPFT